MYIEEDTIDDLLNATYSNLLANGLATTASKGAMLENLNATLVLRHPRSRLSVSESRSQLISCVGELLWYLTADSSLEFITYYITSYHKFIGYLESESTPVLGAYGPRIFKENKDGLSQFSSVANLLVEKPTTRRAVIAIYSAEDTLREDDRDIPCTCIFQFFIRNHQLHLTTYMRSNDAVKGLVHDIFSFTIFQELMLAEISKAYKNKEDHDLVLGTYTHIVGSLHIYKKDIPKVRQYLEVEGWQNKTQMPPINSIHLKDDKKLMIELEKKLRLNDSSIDFTVFQEFKDDFWKDIAIVLIFYHLHKKTIDKEQDKALILTLRDNCSSLPVKTFIEKRIHDLGIA